MSPQFMVIGLAFVLGLVVGSFLNVCIYRLPRDESLWSPGSRCPRCKKPVAPYDNIPLVSYAILSGRCRHCRRRISPRYPAVELLTGLLFAALARRWPQSPAWGIASAAACAAFVAIAFIDWDTFLIPDVLSLGLAVSGLAASPLNPLLGAAWKPRAATSAAGALTGFFICWAVAAFGEWLFKREAMGGGDVKLLAAVGAWSGSLGAIDCLIVASLLGSIYGAAGLLRGRLRRHQAIPFGPFLSAAAILNFFVLLPLGFPFTALAAEKPPARILATDGEVAVRLQGSPDFDAAADPSRRLDPGDAVRTLAGSRAHLALPLDGFGLLQENSTVAFDRDGKRTQVALESGRGLFGVLRAVDYGWSFAVRARGAIASTRDAVFLAEAGEDGACRFQVISGTLYVRAEGTSKRARAGRSIRVAPEKEPEDPTPWKVPAAPAAEFAIKGKLSGAEALPGVSPNPEP